MTGKILVSFLALCAIAAGVAMYWLQIYAFYDDVQLTRDGGTVEMRLTATDGTEAGLDVTGFQGIDGSSSPIRFRACFRVAEGSLEGAQPAPEAVPLTAPGWFDCFDAGAIGAALETGEATAYLGQSNVQYGIDRLIAAFPDGRAYAWHQINRCGAEVFDGNPPPAGCPQPPQGQR